LLTLKAADALAAADIIFHDDLVGRDCFNGCTAERVNVGKRKGNHTMPQESINELLYNEAVRGKRVVRLKGGDPFIFGRGGEEVRYLRERHVAVEVIPGITAAQAVAAESLVPLTERGIADSFTLVSAHGAPGTPARAKTVAVYMGASAKAGAAQRLTAEGFDTDAPVLLVRGASTAGASSTVVPLGKLQEDATPSPLCMVAGEGVRAYSAPRRILYTGIDPFACSFDGKVVHYPLISIEPADNLSSVDLDRYTGVIFTSRNAVRHFFRAAAPGSRELLAIGAATAAEIVRYGYRAAAVADPPDSDALVKLVDGRDHEGRWLYPCSQRSENVLHHHPRIDAVTIYRTVFVDQPTVDLTLFDAVVFSSPSTVESFFRMYTAIPSGCAVYVFGQVTSRKAIEHGISPEVIITALPGGNHE
jgi:uroporphyrinogen III methyltransferase/synthase